MCSRRTCSKRSTPSPVDADTGTIAANACHLLARSINGSSDAFVHISAVERAGMVTLNKEQRVSYELETDRRGKTSAVNLQSA